MNNRKTLLLSLLAGFALQMNSFAGDTITTPSGLKYVITRKGNGEKPVPGTKIKAHYKGMLTNLNVFDESYSRNEPFAFTVGNGEVIQGWDEGFQHIEEGGAGVLIIPPSLGYGSSDMGSIPPNSTLIFEVELVKMLKPIEHKRWEVKKLKPKTYKGGLKVYTISEPKKGMKIDSLDNVDVHYAGYLIDGKKFDASWDRSEPIQFQVKVTSLIKGWQEAIVHMKNGGKYVIEIPPSMAYGERGAGGVIPPNATLIFDMQITKVNGVSAENDTEGLKKSGQKKKKAVKK